MHPRKNNWSQEEEKRLFELQLQLGNKWSTIAARIGEKDDSTVKNKFYSTLRKGLRKINNYITNIKKKQDPAKFKAFRCFPEMLLTKIIAVVDHNYEERFEVKHRAIELASKIQASIVEVACSHIEYLKPEATEYNFEEALLTDVLEFNKHCKKRKGKRKQQEQKEQKEQNFPFVAKNIEESESYQEQSPQNPRKHFTKTKKDKKKAQITFEQKPAITIQNQQSKPKVTQEPVNICSSWQNRKEVQKNSSGNDEMPVPSSVIENKSFPFTNRGQNPISQSGNLSFSSNNWMYDSGNCHYSPSPLPPPDNYSSIAFPNLMKNTNIAHSSQDQNINSIDLFASGKWSHSKQEQNFVSLLDKFPHYQVNNCLIGSTDLQRSTDMVFKKSKSSCKETLPPTPCTSFSDQNSFSQFLSSLNFRGNIDERMKQYSFGTNSQMFKPAEQ